MSKLTKAERDVVRATMARYREWLRGDGKNWNRDCKTRKANEQIDACARLAAARKGKQ